jgi:hypothetical protein
VICPPIVASKEKITPEVLRIFPNPTSGQINIYSYALPNTKCTWTLLDNLGHQVFSQVLDNENISLSLPTSLPKGIYFWRVSNSTEALQQGKLVLLE